MTFQPAVAVVRKPGVAIVIHSVKSLKDPTKEEEGYRSDPLVEMPMVRIKVERLRCKTG